MTTTYSRPGHLSAWQSNALSCCAGCIVPRQAMAVLGVCGEADLIPVVCRSGVPRVSREAAARMMVAIGRAAVAAQ